MVEAVAATQEAKEGADKAALEPFVVPLEGLAERIRAAIEPVIAAAQCELVLLRILGSKKRPILRIYTDTLEVDSGITVDRLEKLNRLIGDLLDVEDDQGGFFSTAYDLEVSSPGVDRPLAKKTHFENAVGSKVKVKRIRGAHGSRSAVGDLSGTSEHGLVIRPEEGGDHPVIIPWDDIAEANTIFTFSQPEKPKGRPGKNKRRGAPGPGGSPSS